MLPYSLNFCLHFYHKTFNFWDISFYIFTTYKMHIDQMPQLKKFTLPFLTIKIEFWIIMFRFWYSYSNSSTTPIIFVLDLNITIWCLAILKESMWEILSNTWWTTANENKYFQTLLASNYRKKNYNKYLFFNK